MKINSGEKKLFVFCALVICLPLVVALFFNRINATPVVSIPPPPVAPKPNGFDLYVAAAKAMTPATPPVDAAHDMQQPTDAKVRAQRYSLARKNAWLVRNSAAFALFDQAMRTPSLAPPVRSSATQLPYLSQLRQLARDKAAESNACWMRGDFNGALQSGLDVVHMGHDTRHGGVLMMHLSGTTLGRIGHAATQGTVEKLNETQARAATQRVEKLLQTRWDLSQNLLEDKYFTQNSLLELFQYKGWRSIDFSTDLTAKGSFKWATAWAERVQTRVTSKQQIVDDISALYDAQIAIARLPYADNSQTEPTFPTDPYAYVFGIDLDDARFREARDLAGDQSLMLQLALRAYRLQNGVYPSTLNALTPTYLQSIPADPFGGGQPWCYKLDGNSYLLWSIGPDGKDDGGTPVPWAKKPVTYPDERARLPFVSPDSKGDYVAGKNG